MTTKEGTALAGSMGGLPGSNLGGTITDCWSTGVVQGGYFSAGLIGKMTPYSPSGRVEQLTMATVASCRSTASVSGDQGIGGLVGWISDGSKISGSGAAGSV